jgi:hypothetical protein
MELPIHACFHREVPRGNWVCQASQEFSFDEVVCRTTLVSELHSQEIPSSFDGTSLSTAHRMINTGHSLNSLPQFRVDKEQLFFLLFFDGDLLSNLSEDFPDQTHIPTISSSFAKLLIRLVALIEFAILKTHEPVMLID